MSDFAIRASLYLSIATIIVASSAIITNAWIHGGLKRDLRVMRRSIKKIILRVRKDIKIALHG